VEDIRRQKEEQLKENAKMKAEIESLRSVRVQKAAETLSN
jgi:hypothetical protein